MTPLDEYVFSDDGAYSYEEVAAYTYDGVTVYIYNMTSQIWFDGDHDIYLFYIDLCIYQSHLSFLQHSVHLISLIWPKTRKQPNLTLNFYHAIFTIVHTEKLWMGS